VDVWEWRWLAAMAAAAAAAAAAGGGNNYFMLCKKEESSMRVISTNSHAVVHKFCSLCVRLQRFSVASVQRAGRKPN
jgi:hypothetical protein